MPDSATPFVPRPLWGVIPVKPLAGSKGRLAGLLTATQRAALIRRCLTRTLTLLQTVPELDRVLVVSRDPEVLALALRHGAEPCLERQPLGLNTAVAQGAAAAAAAGAASLLVLPADLPLVGPEDLRRLLDGLPPAGAGAARLAVCGDEAQQGTNALLLAPPGDFTFQYGPDSFGRHLAEAHRRGRSVAAVSAPGLQFDLDTAHDWRRYQSMQPTSSLAISH